MEGVYFPVRVMKKLKAAGVKDRVDLLARRDELAEMGLSDYDVRLVRRRLGIKPVLSAEGVPVNGGDSAGSKVVVGDELWTTGEAAEYLKLIAAHDLKLVWVGAHRGGEDRRRLAHPARRSCEIGARWRVRFRPGRLSQ